MAEDEQGASPKELLLEACRRDNTELLEEVINTKDCTANFLNSSTDGTGNTALHLCAVYGSHEAMDMLLDQEGLEIDLPNRLEKATPLHLAVEHASLKDREMGNSLVEMLIDAGSDVRIKNKNGRLPIDLVDPRNTVLKSMLQKAQFAQQAGNDVVEDEDSSSSGSESDN